MQRSNKDPWVGLFVVIGAAALLFLSLKAANLLTLSFTDNSYTVPDYGADVGTIQAYYDASMALLRAQPADQASWC